MMTTACDACFEMAREDHDAKTCRDYLTQRRWTKRVLRLLATEPHFPTPSPNYERTTFTSTFGEGNCRPDPWKQAVYALLRKGA